MEHIALGLNRNKALAISGLTKHEYYHKSSGGKRGIKPSDQVVRHKHGSKRLCSNDAVVRYMQRIQMDDDLRCGHRRMTDQLQIKGCEINHKKVYRLMKEHNLLLPKQKRTKRNYVKNRIIVPTQPLSHLEMDIKFMWIEQHRKHALILSVMDIFTRRILEWHVDHTTLCKRRV